MKANLLIWFFLFQSLVFALSPPRWDFKKAYENSNDIFIAEVIEVETSLEITGDQVGKDAETGEAVRLVWPDARRFRLSVQETFKGEQPEVFDVYSYGPAEKKTEDNYQGEFAKMLVYYNDNNFGGPPRPMLKKGAQYLFYLNRNDDSGVTKIGWRSARPLKWRNREVEILRTMSSESSKLSFDKAVKLYEKRMQELEAEKAKNNARVRAEYHTILNQNPDLEERKQKLAEHIGKLGFDGLWHQSKSTHRKLSFPPEAIEEEIWYNASQEIRKIDMILTARQQNIKATKVNQKDQKSSQ